MLGSRKAQFTLLAAVLFVGFGLIANPWIVNPDSMYDPVGEGILILEGTLGLSWLVACCISKLKTVEHSVQTAPVPSGSYADNLHGCKRDAGQYLVVSLLLLYIGSLWLNLFWHRWNEPILRLDDFDYIAIARTWSTTSRHLLTPYNEHICVPTRLLTWALCGFVDESQWPRALARAGMALSVMPWIPLGWFVHRELGSPTLALLAVSFFALTTIHQEVVLWYSASQWNWALLLTLATLLVLQSRDPDLVGWRVATSGILAAIGPLCYTIGISAGLLGTVYLFVRWRLGLTAISFWRCTVPLLGTAACLLVLVPSKAHGILDRASYGGKSVAQASSVPKGVLYGLRSTVDQLVLGNLGFDEGPKKTRVLYAMMFMVVVFGIGESIRRDDLPVLPVVGCAFVVIPYALTLPFRTWVQYDEILRWTRYQLFPQVGFALVVCGVLAAWGPRWLLNERLSVRHVLLVVLVATGLWLVH
jgi:hypothetical protein